MLTAKDFEGEDILSLYDWSREKIECVFKVAKKMEPIVINRDVSHLLADKVIAICFYQPSTRTRTSFQSAAVRLGAHVIGWENAASTRARDLVRVGGEGESDKDTAKMLEDYADVLCVRSDKEGGPQEMAKWASIPVINCGDGPGEGDVACTGEHPTQALLDLYTIAKEKGKIDGLKILLLSSARKRSRHSLNFGLAKFDHVKEYICCPPETRLRPEEEKALNELGLDYGYVDDLKDVIKEVDVIIGGGTQEKFILRASKLKDCKDDLIVMHPLARGVSIAEDVDDTKYARYYQQAWNGVPIRMALLSLVLGRLPAGV